MIHNRRNKEFLPHIICLVRGSHEEKLWIVLEYVEEAPVPNPAPLEELKCRSVQVLPNELLDIGLSLLPKSPPGP